MESDGAGWKLFAGIMIIIGGTFNFIDGLVGITNVNAIENTLGGTQLPLTNNIKTCSWVVLIVGVIMLLAGFLIFSGNMFGRVVGVVAASGNADPPARVPQPQPAVVVHDDPRGLPRDLGSRGARRQVGRRNGLTSRHRTPNRGRAPRRGRGSCGHVHGFDLADGGQVGAGIGPKWMARALFHGSASS